MTRKRSIIKSIRTAGAALSAPLAVATALTLPPALYGCSGSEKQGGQASTTPTGAGDAGAKAIAKQAVAPVYAPAPAPASTLAGAAAGPVTASYRGRAQALGVDVCSGNIDIQVNLSALLGGSVELFNIPQGAVNCSVLGTIDLKGMLGSFGQQTTSGSKAVVDAAHHVISVSSLVGNSYTPPRPLLPALFSATAADLRALDVKTDLTLATADGKSAHGHTEVKMLSYDQPYMVPSTGREFPHVIDFIILNDGFSGVDKYANMLFDSMEFHLSLDPIAILSLTFKGNLQSVLTTADAAAAASAPPAGPTPSPSFITSVVGALPPVPVEMTIDLIDQTGLDAAVAAAVKSGNNGDSLGGHPVSSP